MATMEQALPIISFATRGELRAWLSKNHDASEPRNRAHIRRSIGEKKVTLAGLKTIGKAVRG
jgi:hypothetical protein